MNAVFSFDIGIHNLGYAIRTDDDLEFGIFDIDNHIAKGKSVTIERIYILRRFMETLCERFRPSKIIIEKQVQHNTIAMEIMYCLASICTQFVTGNELIIFDPKLKFTTLRIPYETKNKAHKKLSITMCSNLLSKIYPSKLDAFSNHEKRDDIADAINMIYIHDCIVDNNKILVTKNNMIS